VCDIDFDESPEIWRRTEQRARVVHWCSTCGRIIHTGERYERTFAVCQGETVNQCACVGCSRAIETFGAAHDAWPFPVDFMNFLHECIIDDDEGARWRPMYAAITRRRRVAKARGESRWAA
jgi:hypothetical protein